jgi:hypothetical protein
MTPPGAVTDNAQAPMIAQTSGDNQVDRTQDRQDNSTPGMTPRQQRYLNRNNHINQSLAQQQPNRQHLKRTATAAQQDHRQHKRQRVTPGGKGDQQPL